MSIEGTLVTDNLTDNLGIELWKTTLIFASALAVTFMTWYWFERTLDIHSIYTVRRELWYWLAILFTFALGTSFGDLISQYLADATLAVSGFAAAVLVFAGWIAAIAGIWATGLLPPVPAFWCTYVMTRPLGASIGDLLSQDREAGGLGLGTSTTSLILMAIIVTATLYLAWSGADLIRSNVSEADHAVSADSFDEAESGPAQFHETLVTPASPEKDGLWVAAWSANPTPDLAVVIPADCDNENKTSPASMELSQQM